jgi:coatomer subunit beta'
VEKGQNNIAFACFLQLGDTAACMDVLSKTDRLPEAALFARSYAPAAIPSIVKSWRGDLESKGKGKIAQTLADPEEDESLFEEGWVKEEGGGPAAANGAAEVPVLAAPVDDSATNGDSKDETKGPIEAVVEKVKELAVGSNDGK